MGWVWPSPSLSSHKMGRVPLNGSGQVDLFRLFLSFARVSLDTLYSFSFSFSLVWPPYPFSLSLSHAQLSLALNLNLHSQKLSWAFSLSSAHLSKPSPLARPQWSWVQTWILFVCGNTNYNRPMYHNQQANGEGISDFSSKLALGLIELTHELGIL